MDTDSGSVSILPSINDDVNTLLLSFVLSSSLFVLLFHHMVTYPSLRLPDRLLISIFLSLNSPSLRSQRSVRISSLSSVASPVHRMCFLLIPVLLPRDLASSSTLSLVFCSVKDAKRYLEKHKRIENAIDAYYNEGGGSSSSRTTPSGSDPATITQRLNQMYDTYKGLSSISLLQIPLISFI